MDKEYFKKRRDEILDEIESWRQELNDLEKDYISSNQKYPIGTKLCVTIPEHVGYMEPIGIKKAIPEEKIYLYVSGHEIRYGDVCPVFMKAKKDGTMSKVRDYSTYRGYKIEVVELEKEEI